MTTLRSLLMGMALVGLVLGVAEAQNFEYGSPAELKGVVWIYVDVQENPKWREDILDEIREELPHVRFAQSLADAEAVVYFTGRASSYYAGMHTTMTSTCSSGACDGWAYSTPQYRTVIEGRGQIYVLPDQGKPRLIFDTTNAARRIWDKRPSVKFAKEFVKQYQAANATPPADATTRARRSERIQAAQAAEAAKAAEAAIHNPVHEALLARTPADRLLVFAGGLGSVGYACLPREAVFLGQLPTGVALWGVTCEQGVFIIDVRPDAKGTFSVFQVPTVTP